MIVSVTSTPLTADITTLKRDTEGEDVTIGGLSVAKSSTGGEYHRTGHEEHDRGDAPKNIASESQAPSKIG
jgi:hypothetical protein